jgi:hypothetical protein
MTLVVIHQQANRICCYADSRLTQNETPLIESAAKIFIVPITVSQDIDHKVAPVFHHSLGFAFAGSAILATNTHAIASTLTQLLFAKDAGRGPSVEDVARIYAAVGDHVTRDLNARLHQKDWAYFCALLFGYCSKDQSLKVYVVEPEIGSQFRMASKLIPLPVGEICAIGSGATPFNEYVSAQAKTRRSLHSLFVEFVRESGVSSVGGHMQFGEATEAGMSIRPILVPEDGDTHNTRLCVLGFDTTPIRLEGFGIALNAVYGGTEEDVPRKYWIERGLGSNPPQDIRNAAAIEMGLKVCVAQKVKFNLGRGKVASIVNKQEPGKYYVAITCWKCGKVNLICKDATEGKIEETITGKAIVDKQCDKCGTAICSRLSSVQAT